MPILLWEIAGQVGEEDVDVWRYPFFVERSV
jgi:hypothetical protein